jgi:hypothetical protein
VKVTRKVMREVEITIDAICNKCGESCVPVAARGGGPGVPIKWNKETGNFDVLTKEQALMERGPDLYGLIGCVVSGGYYSSNDEKGLSDMEKYTFSLCEGCLRSLFDSFKVPVQQQEYDFG